MEELYNLLYNFRFKEALNLSKELYKPKHVDKGFFITYTDSQLLSMVKTIRSSDSIANMGFTNSEQAIIKTMFCTYYMCPNFSLNEKLISSIDDIENKLRKSSKIKNKYVPFLDLKNLLKGEVVKKIKAS